MGICGKSWDVKTGFCLPCLTTYWCDLWPVTRQKRRSSKEPTAALKMAPPYSVDWIMDSLNSEAGRGCTGSLFCRSVIQPLRVEEEGPKSLNYLEARVGLEHPSRDFLSSEFFISRAASSSWFGCLCCWKTSGLARLSDSSSSLQDRIGFHSHTVYIQPVLPLVGSVMQSLHGASGR